MRHQCNPRCQRTNLAGRDLVGLSVVRHAESTFRELELGWINFNVLPAPPLTEADFEVSAQPVNATQLDHLGDDVGGSLEPQPETSQPALPVDPAPRNQDRTVASLFGLDPHQLVQQFPPLVLDAELCHSMRGSILLSDTRLQLLNRQHSAWADDEVWWHMQNLPCHDRRSKVALLDPLLAYTWLNVQSLESVRSWLDLQTDFDRIVTCIPHEGHWTPCVWVPKLTTLEVHMWDHDSVDVEPLNPLHGLLCRALGLQMFRLTCNRRQFGTTNCGAASVAFLQHQVQGMPLPTSDQQLQHASDSLRDDFRMSHEGFPQMPRPWCWGMGAFDVVSVTANLLKQHGVPDGAALSRAKLLLQSLGHD